MTDFYLPQDIDPGEVRWGAVESTAIFAADTTGAIRSSEIVGGNALTATFVWPPLKDQSATLRQRSRLISVLRVLRGQANRIWFGIPGHEEPSWAPELLSNNTFANGTTGWTDDGECALSVNDRVMRVTALRGGSALEWFQAVALTQYAPHVLRAFVQDGKGTAGLSIGPSLTDGSISAQDYTATRGLKTVANVSLTGSAQNQFPAVLASGSGFTAGDYFEVPWCSLSRCALVCAGPNLLLRSDEFDNAAWANVRTTDAANSTEAPDGTTTADSIIEDASASTTHYIVQTVSGLSAAALDYSYSVALKAGTRGFARVSMQETAASHECYVDVNLSTGALGTATASGANWTNPRAFSVDMGNGWWRVTIVGRKASAATQINAIIFMASALGTISYTGDGASLIYAWRATLAQSSVPTRLVATTTTAQAATAQTGNGIHIKGLPASTTGLRKAGHWVQIGRELHQLAASLDSDAAGMAFMQLCNPPRNAPADNDPVIFNNPMGKFLMANSVLNWKDMPGLFSNLEVEFLEATAG